MLLVNPAWLFDVGFQLSFLAVLSILMIQKPVYQLLPVKSRIGKYVWGLMSVSIAAQIGTAPLVMLYFSRFSTHFLLTNLVVIPLVTVTLYAAVLMLLLTPLPAVQFVMAGAVRFLLKVLNDFCPVGCATSLCFLGWYLALSSGGVGHLHFLVAFPLLFEDPKVQESCCLPFLPVVFGHLSHGHALV